MIPQNKQKKMGVVNSQNDIKIRKFDSFYFSLKLIRKFPI